MGCVLFFLLCLALALVGSVKLIGQTTSFTEDEAQKNLTKHVYPVYPAIAKAAHIQGKVQLQAEIDINGKVTAVKILSGPPMLQEAAISAVKLWEYSPFEQNGSPVAATIPVTVSFALEGTVDPKEDEIARVYFPLSSKCVQLVSQRADPSQQVLACELAAQQADQFSTNSRFIERRAAYVYYATALMRDKKTQDAIAAADKAVNVVLQGHDDGSGSSAAYGVRGQAKAFNGDLAGADKDLEVAEAYERKAIAGPSGQALGKSYSQTLKSLLTFHSQVLNTLGRQSDSQAKLNEANKL